MYEDNPERKSILFAGWLKLKSGTPGRSAKKKYNFSEVVFSSVEESWCVSSMTRVTDPGPESQEKNLGIKVVFLFGKSVKFVVCYIKHILEKIRLNNLSPIRTLDTQALRALFQIYVIRYHPIVITMIKWKSFGPVHNNPYSDRIGNTEYFL